MCNDADNSQVGIWKTLVWYLLDNEHVTNLGTLGGNTCVEDIDNCGQVVGYGETSETKPGDHHAFLWEDGKMGPWDFRGGQRRVLTS